MDSLELIIDQHLNNDRQGPGGAHESARALALCGLDQSATIQVADIGCGTGAATLSLASKLNAKVTAVDFLAPFIEKLEHRAAQAGLTECVDTLVASMDDLSFEPEQFDLIWSEGAIYNMGFTAGVEYWRRFLKPGGVLAVSEITWTTASRPAPLEGFWQQAYPEIATASEKFAVLEQAGYSPIGYFTLGEHCWLENYYQPLQAGKADFLRRHGSSEDALAVVNELDEEQGLYEKYKEFYSYGFYIARIAGEHPSL